MKTHAILTTALLLASPAFGAFETCTNKDGRRAELELIRVTTRDGLTTGEFRSRAGTSVTLPADQFDTAGQAKLEAAKSAAAEAGAPPSVFQKQLESNLLKLDGHSLHHAAVPMPTKYYAFYYTASWCHYCQTYTPTLVQLYNRIKPGNPKFEVFTISRDSDEKDLEGYVKSKSMPWPVLRLRQVAKFEKAFNHDVNGIPTVVVCDPTGKVLLKTQDNHALESLFTQ